MTAATACRMCGTELREGARFCDGCGAPVTEQDTRAEYKQVTVLFADVVRSMDIAAAVGPERLREIMAVLADRCAAAVKRYGGTVDKFTGDGIMAVFGAPVALEDHAVRACFAALGIQVEAARLTPEIKRRDGVDLRLRVGLNSGQVIAGQIGSGPSGYTAIGQQVGMARRMESAASPGEVMLSASTARLVEGAADLGAAELVQIKGVDESVPARRLLGMVERTALGRAESNLVGRRWERSAVEGLLDRALGGRGAVATVVGSPGIGKSRLMREEVAIAAERGVEVFTAHCDSHASDIPFHVVARLLRAAAGVRGLDNPAARDRVRSLVPDADPEDVLLFDDLLGIADHDVELPKIDPDARRRRLTALVNTASLARRLPAVYVIEDAHWIDEVSESMIAEFLTVIPQTPSLVLITHRPEYRGALSRVPGAQTIALAPLSNPETAALVTELLGSDPSVGAVVTMITEKAAGNPFFAEEMVRDLAERGVLRGNRSAYESSADAPQVSVPATLQATITARIDRLDAAAKRTLGAAAVIGSRFSRELLETLGIDPVFESLLRGDFIDQITFTRQPEYVFHHPLICTVAYESQLKSDRAALHRRVAVAVEERDPESADQNAALIAEHLEAAGDLPAAYGWRMRAGAWSTRRDIAAARVSWERAGSIADELPTDYADRTAMRIAPRTMMCATASRGEYLRVSRRIDELRELCTAAGDKASLAIGMFGLGGEHVLYGRVREGARIFAEQMTVVESIADPTLIVGLSVRLVPLKVQLGEVAEVLQWSQRAIELTDGDPTMGNGILGLGSPLGCALVGRGIARWWLGQSGWREDLAAGVELARRADAATYATLVGFKYGFAVTNGVLFADDAALADLDEALRITEGLSDDYVLGMAKYVLALALLHQDSPADRQRGLELLAQARDMCLHHRYYLSEMPIIDFGTALERARGGDRDGAIPQLRQAVDDMFDAGQLGYWITTNAVFAETLLERGADGDVADAEAAVDRLAAVSADHGWVISEVWLLRLRALLARAHGDEARYREYRDRYRNMATSLGFDGHIAWADAMP
jgi:class 3 adenylate cyclase